MFIWSEGGAFFDFDISCYVWQTSQNNTIYKKKNFDGAFLLHSAFSESAFFENAFFESAFLESAFLESAFSETYRTNKVPVTELG